VNASALSQVDSGERSADPLAVSANGAQRLVVLGPSAGFHNPRPYRHPVDGLSALFMPLLAKAAAALFRVSSAGLSTAIGFLRLPSAPRVLMHVACL